MPAPKRLGLVTSHKLLTKVKQLITKYYEELQTWLTSEEFAKVVALLNCINDFLSDVPQYPSEP